MLSTVTAPVHGERKLRRDGNAAPKMGVSFNKASQAREIERLPDVPQGNSEG